jgi:hypothetical protein
MSSFQAPGVQIAKLDTPEANRLSANSDASFSEQIFNISTAQIEAIVQPDCIGDDIWRESVAFVGIHMPILATSVT